MASRNKGKINELKSLLSGTDVEVVSLDSFSFVPEIEETGSTFEQNAVIKARAVARLTGCASISDDSGLEVDFLNGAPGVFSSRFAGRPGDDAANNEKLLLLLKGVPFEKRTARFRCVIALALPDGEVYTAEGVCEGWIAEEPRGSGGFGYDPLFVVEGYDGMTMAELGMDVKNAVSHRAKALKKIIPVIEKLAKKS